MKVKAYLVLAATVVALSGCTHSVMRGTVAMKTSDSEAHVCMGQGEVKAGDRVTLFRNVCTPPVSTRVPGRVLCEKREIGKGTVQEVLNEHYSVVKFDPGVQFEEGTFVEKR